MPCAAGVFLIVLVYSHLAARIPITGFAYQWNSRLINPHYGWFTGYTALLAFIAGTAATAVALATVFASDIWKSPPTATSCCSPPSPWPSPRSSTSSASGP